MKITVLDVAGVPSIFEGESLEFKIKDRACEIIKHDNKMHALDKGKVIAYFSEFVSVRIDD